ncbi:unnamed protein product, partial [Meganyctiphanes norvegica]
LGISGGSSFPHTGSTTVGAASGNCNCQPVVVCFSEIEKNLPDCPLGDGSSGVCCPPDSPSSSSTSQRVLVESRIQVNAPSLSQQQINEASQKGKEMVTSRKQRENQLIKNGNVIKEGTPAFNHLRFNSVTAESRKLNDAAQLFLETTKSLVVNNRLSNEEGGHGLRSVSVRQSQLRDLCPKEERCSSGLKYRTPEGHCNNLQQTTWGKANMPYQRVALPTYDDGVSSPRTRAADGSELPNVRDLANSVLVDNDLPDQKYTLSLMQWGQFVDHDIAHSPGQTLDNGAGPDCCTNINHPACMPIRISSNDGFFRSRTSCISFIRSMVSLTPQCSMG